MKITLKPKALKIKTILSKVPIRSKKARILSCILIITIAGLLIFLSLRSKEITIPALQPKINEATLPENIRQFGIVINKLDLAMPVMKDIDSQDEKGYQEALTKGLAHAKGTGLPGQKNNIFIFGHSSSDVGYGQYAKAFAKLNDLENDNLVVVYYENSRLEYKVKEKKIVEAGETQYLMPSEYEKLTLMTCWPIGTDKQRLIVIAEPKEQK